MVTVIKSTPSGGFEPGVIIIITVSSVEGGVGVAAIAYILNYSKSQNKKIRRIVIRLRYK